MAAPSASSNASFSDACITELLVNGNVRLRAQEAFQELGLTIAELRDSLGLYPFPASLFFERSLHFIAVLDVPK